MLVALRPRSCLVRLCFALKWLKPGLRVKSLPEGLTRILLLNDLFVFIYYLLLFLLSVSFESDNNAFWTSFRRFGDLVRFGDQFEYAIESFVEKLLVHILCSSRQKQLSFDAVTFV